MVRVNKHSALLFSNPPTYNKDTVEETGDVLYGEAVEVENDKVPNKLQEAHANDKGVSNEQLMETILRVEQRWYTTLKPNLSRG